MADKKISDMTVNTAAQVGVDTTYLPVVDTTATPASSQNKRMTLTEIAKAVVQYALSFVQSGSGLSSNDVQSQLRKSEFFDTIAALKAWSAPTVSTTAFVRGYYSAGDGGGGMFVWNGTDATTDNGGTVIKPTAVVGNGRWNRIYDASQYSVHVFGAKGDGVTDDYAAIMSAINSQTHVCVIFASNKNYKINTGLSWSDKCVWLLGAGSGQASGSGTRITAAAGITAINPVQGAGGLGARSRIEGLHIVGSDSLAGGNDGIRMECNEGQIRDVMIEGFAGYGVHIKGDVNNANGCRGDHIRCYNNKTGGFHTVGTNGNAGAFTNIDCDTNGGYGISENSSLLNFFFGVHLSSNTTGAIQYGPNSGAGGRMYGVYFESENKPALTVDVASGGSHVVEFSQCSRPDATSPIADSATAKSFVLFNQNALHWRFLKVATDTAGGTGNITLDGTGATAQISCLLGAQQTFQNVAATANWTASVNASKQLNLNSAQGEPLLLNGNALQLPVPGTIAAATYTVAASDTYLFANNAGTVTLTLPAAASYPGRPLFLSTITANAVVSASSNVVPQAGGAAGTAVLAATAGKWAILVSDNANWRIMASN